MAIPYPAADMPRQARAGAFTPSVSFTAAWLGRWLLVALPYYLTARLGLLIPYVGTHVSLVWLPTGIAVAAYLRWGAAVAPAVVVAAMAANAAIGSPWWLAAAVGLGNALGPWVTVLLLRRWRFDAGLARQRDLAIFLVATLLGMVITATNGTWWLHEGGLLDTPHWLGGWLSWWIGDAVGALLGGVPLVAMNRASWRGTFGGQAGAWNTLLLMLVLACGLAAFSPWLGTLSALTFPLVSLPFFLVTLMALRGGVLASSLAVLLLSVTAAFGTARGFGPFAGHDAHAGILALWSYITAQACTSLLVCGMAAEAETARRRLVASEQRLRLITDNIPALISYVDKNWRLLFTNKTFEDWFGMPRAASLGRHVRDVFGEANFGSRRAYFEEAIRTAQNVSFELQIEGASKPRVVRTTYVPDCAPDGQVRGVYAVSIDISDLKAVEARLTELARVDHLTGLPNRREFECRLEEALARARCTRQPLTLMFIDLDHFKDINDSFGHAAGDEVLRAFGQRLQGCVRSSDLVARLAGDEFVIVPDQLRGGEEAQTVARKVLAAMQEPVQWNGHAIPVSASIGIGLTDSPADASSTTLMATADKALYAAKHDGRSTWRLGRCTALH